jgi:hypothetical protein
VHTIPTIGFNVEDIKYEKISFNVWDVGGQAAIRPLWRHYYQNTQCLIFVVDSNDKVRVGEAHDELHRMLSEDELREAIVLVLANKQVHNNCFRPARPYTASSRARARMLSRCAGARLWSVVALVRDETQRGPCWTQIHSPP